MVQIGEILIRIAFIVTCFQAYHSQYTNPPKLVGNMALLPLKTSYKGPAPKESWLLFIICYTFSLSLLPSLSLSASQSLNCDKFFSIEMFLCLAFSLGDSGYWHTITANDLLRWAMGLSNIGLGLYLDG